jgi:hypothetical protein
MTDFLEDKRAEIDRRLEELRAAHDEYLKLERAKQALDGLDGPAPAPARRGPGRPRGSGAGSSASRAKRRPRREGGRAADALEQVRQNPGISVNELAERLNMPQKNYLYRIMANLQSEGAVRKEGRGFVAV